VNERKTDFGVVVKTAWKAK